MIGRSDRVLGRGEAAEFHTWLPHWVGGVDAPVELLVIFSPDGRPLRPLAAPPQAGAGTRTQDTRDTDPRE